MYSKVTYWVVIFGCLGFKMVRKSTTAVTGTMIKSHKVILQHIFRPFANFLLRSMLFLQMGIWDFDTLMVKWRQKHGDCFEVLQLNRNEERIILFGDCQIVLFRFLIGRWKQWEVSKIDYSKPVKFVLFFFLFCEAGQNQNLQKKIWKQPHDRTEL